MSLNVSLRIAITNPNKVTYTQGLSKNDLEKINPDKWWNLPVKQIHDTCNNLFYFK